MDFKQNIKLIQDIGILVKKGYTVVQSDDKLIIYLYEGLEDHFSDFDSLEEYVNEEIRKLNLYNK